MNDDDLVREARQFVWADFTEDEALGLVRELADRIEQLQADNARLTAALTAANEELDRLRWEVKHRARLTQTGTDRT